MAEYLQVGKKVKYIFHLLTNIQVTQTSTPEMKCTQKRNDELLHGTKLEPIPIISLENFSTIRIMTLMSLIVLT